MKDSISAIIRSLKNLRIRYVYTYESFFFWFRCCHEGNKRDNRYYTNHCIYFIANITVCCLKKKIIIKKIDFSEKKNHFGG